VEEMKVSIEEIFASLMNGPSSGNEWMQCYPLAKKRISIYSILDMRTSLTRDV
jgi:hypothetical protein